MKQLRLFFLAALVAALCLFAGGCSGVQGVNVTPPGSTAGVSISVQTSCTASGALACVQMPTTPKGGTSVPVTFTITNTSTGSPAPALTILTDSITGTNAGDFTIVSTTCPVGTGTSLQAGQSCTVTLTFSPSSSTVGAESASFNFMYQFGSQAATSGTVALMGTETAAGPGVTFSPAPLAFSMQLQGTTSGPLAVTLTNTGSATLIFASAPTIMGTNAIDFTITSATCGTSPPIPLTTGTQVPQNGTCSVSVTFKPATNGAESATLVFTDNANPATQTVSITGSGFLPVVSLPSSLPFGSVLKGTTSSAMSVMLMNTGNGPLTFTSNPSVSGANSADFAISSVTCSTANQVAAGGSCTITLKFSPSTTAAENATLNFADNASPPAQTVSLTGTGSAPVVSLTPTPPNPLAFGTIPQHSTSSAMSVTLMNTGTAALTFSMNPMVTGTNAGDFSITGMTCSTANSVPVNGSCTVTLTFTPFTTSAESASLIFTDNNNAVNGSMQTVSLTGTGSTIPAPVVNLPSTEPFGSVPKGSTSAQMTVTLMNTGNAPLNFSSNPSLMGTNAADFAIVAAMTTCSTGSPVAAGASCVVVLTFTPSTASGETATLNFADNATPNTQSVTLTGTGTAPAVSLPGSLPFGNVTQGVTSPAMTVTLMNTGNGSLNFTSAPGITGANAGDFNITSSTCMVGTPIVAGGGCTVMVTFKPSTTAGENASLNFADNATPSTQSVTLTGTGTPSGMPVVSLPPNVQYNSVSVGMNSTMTVTLTNTGTAALNFTSNPGITGTNAADFTITASTCMTGTPVASGNGTCTVSVKFTPSLASGENASLNFADNASPSSQSVPLMGTGTAAVASVPASLPFNSVPVTPASMQMAVTFKNTGNVNLIFSSNPGASGTNAADFVITASTCSTGSPLTPNSTCSVTITFTPAATATTESAMLNFADNAVTGSGAQSVMLTGTGIHWIGLTGMDSSTPGVTSYNVYRGTSSGGEGASPVFSCSDLTTPTSCMDTTGAHGTMYFYFVRAVLLGVESSNSNEASATFP
jgi:Cep192 domain 4/HYDIN/CFA65/VesB-like, Ig-like domain